MKLKTSPSTSRISSGFPSLNSPSKWLYVEVIATLNMLERCDEIHHRVSSAIYESEWFPEITYWCTGLSIYDRLCIAVSETVKQSFEPPFTAGHAPDRC